MFLGGNLFFENNITTLDLEMDKPIYIKNMVCDRCKMVVEELFRKNDLEPVIVQLGEVHLQKEPTAEQLQIIDEELKKVGFERIDDRKARIIEKIKNVVINTIHHSDELNLQFNWSTVLSQELHHDYNYLSSLFSSVEGITLEQYIIKQKIEKVKELLFYDELTLTEISYKLGYSSVPHLSSQFKKITGCTPSEFKRSRQIDAQRQQLDSI